LMTGVKTDIAVKIYGEDLDELFKKANQAADMISGMEGAADIKVEQITGLPQYLIKYDRAKIARYGINISDLNDLIQTSFAGKSTGIIYEGERRFDLVVRMDSAYRQRIIPENLFIKTRVGNQVPLSEVADIKFIKGPAQIARDDTKRRVTIGINVRNRDVESLVEEINNRLSTDLDLKPGYYLTYGGAFENLENARKRLRLAVPLALILILVLLFFTFNSVKYALLIFSAVPLSAVGGIFALLIRGMPFSISAGVGFIALFGIAVLNGIVLISYYNELKNGGNKDIRDIVVEGANGRLRPVMMTAITDVLGFLPMAISVSAGAEVQRPLATVVIGGIITSTLLTMIILPILYMIFNSDKKVKIKRGTLTMFAVAALLILPKTMFAQETERDSGLIDQQKVVQSILSDNPEYQNALLMVDKARASLWEEVNIPMTSFSYQRGQINSAIKDQYIEINQSLGSVLKNIRSYKKQKTLLAAAELEKTFIERQIIHEALLSFNNWVFYYNLQKNHEKIFDYFRELSGIAEMKLRAGDINSIEKTFLMNEYFQAKQRYLETSSSLSIAENSFRNLVYGESSLDGTPDPDFMILFTIPPDSLRNDLIALQTTYQEVLQESIQKNLSMERSSFFPEISGGYFNQQLDGVSGFQGWQVGVNFPLLPFKESASIKKLKIQKEISQNHQVIDRRNFINRINNLIIELATAEENLLDFEKRIPEEQSTLLDALKSRYEKGEIDYITFSQGVRMALKISEDYLLLLKKLNELKIDLLYMNPPVTQIENMQP